MNLREAKSLVYGNHLYHKKWKNADGSPYKVKVNGKPQTWKTRPNEIRIPIKRGLYEYGHITEHELNEWSLGYQSRLPKSKSRFIE